MRFLLYSVPRLVVQEEMRDVPGQFFDTIDRLARGEPAAGPVENGPPDAGELLRIAERLGGVQIGVPTTLMRHLLAVLYAQRFVVFTRE
jgi:hypothetical protein